ncbi:CTP synthase [bacterium]|nr:CTP synthase [bacterium]
MKKFIFVVGGVMSSVGKGVTSSSISAILKSHGYKTTNIKCDMYVNIDAGTIRPTEHGEVFVGSDGIEADQDLGNYERFTLNTMSAENYITTGQVYQEVIRKERNLEYKGEDVEVVPDVPNEIIRRIKNAQKTSNAEITIIEFGGTIGEYQVLLFLEAARIMKIANPEDIAFVMVSYLPLPTYLGEMKTKPTQYAMRSLNTAGIQADFIVARGTKSLDDKRRQILAHTCNIKAGSVISAPDVKTIYEIPELYKKQNFDEKILETLGLESREKNKAPFEDLVKKIKSTKKIIKVGIVGKYFKTGDFTLIDSYISVIEAIKHGGWANNTNIDFMWIDAEKFEKDKNDFSEIDQCSAIVCPGGFGERGTAGVMRAIQHIRENNIPFLGICFGMQLACVEFAKNALKIKNATSAEFNPKSKDQIIHVNPTQTKNIKDNKYGGTMRLGSYKVEFAQESITQKAYNSPEASERHRHRYEFNNKYKYAIENAGMKIVGVNPETNLVEVVELANHPFFVGVQYHPEFKSHPENAHPLFKKLIEVGLKT